MVHGRNVPECCHSAWDSNFLNKPVGIVRRTGETGRNRLMTKTILRYHIGCERGEQYYHIASGHREEYYHIVRPLCALRRLVCAVVARLCSVVARLDSGLSLLCAGLSVVCDGSSGLSVLCRGLSVVCTGSSGVVAICGDLSVVCAGASGLPVLCDGLFGMAVLCVGLSVVCGGLSGLSMLCGDLLVACLHSVVTTLRRTQAHQTSQTRRDGFVTRPDTLAQEKHQGNAAARCPSPPPCPSPSPLTRCPPLSLHSSILLPPTPPLFVPIPSPASLRSKCLCRKAMPALASKVGPTMVTPASHYI
jgi:hypothetical protein